jgi:peptidoglycan/xylan/chitin deacetylase (PgdA/CDA1 family)
MTVPGRATAGAGTATGRLGLRRVPMILMYHGVADVADDPHLLCVPPARFAEQMAWLKRRGLRGVGIGTLVDAMGRGRARKLVGITFDDGYTSVLDKALPELKRHGFGASVFIISGRLGGTNDWDEGPVFPLMSGAQVRELAAEPRERLAAEVGGSKAALTALLDAPVRGFAYPYGSMDAAARRAVQDAGYAYACAVEAPVAEIGRMALPRIYVGQRDGAGRMAAKRLLYRGYIAVNGRRQ